MKSKKVKANLHRIQKKSPEAWNSAWEWAIRVHHTVLESPHHKQIWKYSSEFKWEPVHSFILLIRQHGPLCACEYRTEPWFKPSVNLSSKVILIPICGAFREPCGLMSHILIFKNITEFRTCKRHCLVLFSQEEGAAVTQYHTALTQTDQQTTQTAWLLLFKWGRVSYCEEKRHPKKSI